MNETYMFSIFNKRSNLIACFWQFFKVFTDFFFDKLVLLNVAYVSKDALNIFLAHFSAKDYFSSAKNVVFPLLCILVDRPMPKPPPPSISMNLEKGL